MKPAVFLDRDGVINEMVLNLATGEYEPPHYPEEIIIFPKVIESLRILQDAGFDLFIVSNQPDYAKGKTSLENIHAIHNRLAQIFIEKDIHFQDFYYCFHHPQGIIPEYSFSCECRKPKPYFILRAASQYGIDLKQSWMIGDRDSDIECGINAGVKTITVEYRYSNHSRGKVCPDFSVENIKEAIKIILSTKKNFCEFHESIKPI